MPHFIYGAFWALAAIALGALGGYRYAEGRCAIEREAAQMAVEQNLAAALETASDNIKAANTKAEESAKRYAALDTRQTKERNDYANAVPAPDCQLDPAAFRLLLDQIRRANGQTSSDHSG